MKVAESRRFLKRHFLSVILTALMLPLGVILFMQFRSLRTLEQTLPVYRRELMFRYLRTVTDVVERLYSDNSERVLAVPREAIVLPPSGIIQDEGGRAAVAAAVEQVAAHFKGQEFRGAGRFFIAVAAERNGTSRDEVLFYDPARDKMEFDDQAPEIRAIKVACAAYMIYVRTQTQVVPQSMGVDRDPMHPLMVKPVLDSEKRIVGIAGMTLDREWFMKEVVPNALETTLSTFFPAEHEHAVITLRFDEDELVYSNQQGDDQPPEVYTHFPPGFWRYTLGIRMRDLSIQQWARSNVIINLSLSLAMTVMLVGGLLVGLRAASREIKLSQMKTDFVANVSHELRTPLASIRVFAEMLKLGRVTHADKVRDYGSYIETQERRLTRLINNILDFSSIESGQKIYQCSATDLREVVAEVLETCAGRLKQSGHTIDFETVELPAPVVVDHDAMVLALTNLVDNAIKYSGEATVITIRLGSNEGFAIISVRDCGIGIPRDEQEKIFDKFYRVSTGMVHEVKGSGLGLSIVKHIVQAHGGKVTVESEPGCGSTFTIHLPIEKPVTSAPGKPLSRSGAESDVATLHSVTALK